VLEKTYQLVIRKGPKAGQTIPLTAPTITLGRDPMADVVLDDAEVSRFHARMVQTEEGYRLEDLGSTNGTFVDGRNIGAGPLLLEPGQEVQMGSSVILDYQLAEADSAEPLAREEEAGETAVPPTIVPTDLLAEAEPPASESPDPMLPPSFDEPEYFEPLPTLRQLQETLEATPEAEPELPDLPEIPSLSVSDLSTEPAPKARPRVVPAAEPAAPPPARGSSNRRIVGILAAVLLILLCCCCGFLIFMYQWGGDWLLRQMQLLP